MAAVSLFGSWFAGRLCLRVDAAVYIADLSVGCMHDPPKVSWGESSFSRGESRAFYENDERDVVKSMILLII